MADPGFHLQHDVGEGREGERLKVEGKKGNGWGIEEKKEEEREGDGGGEERKMLQKESCVPFPPTRSSIE